MAAKRLEESEYKRLVDANAATARRVKDQTPYPEGTATVRRLIEELRSGQPDYNRMSTNLANVTRQQLPQLQGLITGLGAIQTINFKGVGPAGPDIYEIKFEKGSVEYRIWLGPDGKTENAGIRPLQ